MDDREQSNFASVCWVEVVDYCGLVCPRHELSGDLGHAYCLNCLLRASSKVQNWDMSLEDAGEEKHAKMQALSQAFFSEEREENDAPGPEASGGAAGGAAVYSSAPPSTRGQRQRQPQPQPSSSLAFRAAAAELATKFRSRSTNAEKGIEDAQSTYYMV